MRGSRQLGAVLLVAAIAAGSSLAALELGQGPPRVEADLVNERGGTAGLGHLGDSGLLVIFHSPSCGSSLDWEGRLFELGNFAAYAGVRTVLVDPTAAGRADLALGGGGTMKFDHLADPEQQLVEAFGASTLPEAFLFDGGGRLVYHGELDHVREAVEAVTARQPIPVAQIAPSGCAILPVE